MRRPMRGMAIVLLVCFLLGMRLDFAVQAQPQEDVGAEVEEQQAAEDSSQGRRRIRNPLHRFARGVARGGKRLARGVGKVLRLGRKGAQFVVSVPRRIADKLGIAPGVVPILEALLIKKFPAIYRRARGAEALGQGYDRARADYLTQREKIELTRAALREAAEQLRMEAGTADRLREALGRELLRDPSTLRDYMPISVDLQTVAEQRRESAQRCEEMARGLTPQKLLNTIITRPVERFITQTAPRIIGQELGRQVLPKVDPSVIQQIVDPRPMTVDRLIEVILEGDLSQLRAGGNLGIDIDVDALVETIREQFKEELKRERGELKGKWRERLKELLQEKLQAAQRELGREDTEGAREGDDQPEGEEPFELVAGAVTGGIMTKPVGDEQPENVGTIALVITDRGVIGGNLEIEYVEEDEAEGEGEIEYDAIDALAAGSSGLRVNCEQFSGTVGAFEDEQHYPFKAEGSASIELFDDDGWSRPKVGQVTVDGAIRRGNRLAGTLKVGAHEFTWTAR